MALPENATIGDTVQQGGRSSWAIEPGTPLHKAIPPRMVEPYLSGRRAVIAGFVHRVADSTFSRPRDYYYAFSLDYEGSEFSPDMTELYLLRWRAVSAHNYLVPYSVALGGDWAMKPPFTGTGYTAGSAHPVPEFFTDPVPVPVGAEIYRISDRPAECIARYDGQLWQQSPEGM